MPPKILAVDIGTHTGIAHNLAGPLIAETWTLAKDSEVAAWGKQRLTRRKDPRMERFSTRLASLPARPDIVIFEDVQFSSYTLQCQMWASFRTVLWLAFPGVFFECVPVTKLKLFATGSGAATKQDMKDAYEKKFPKFPVSCLGFDAIDALWLHVWATTRLAQVKL